MQTKQIIAGILVIIAIGAVALLWHASRSAITSEPLSASSTGQQATSTEGSSLQPVSQDKIKSASELVTEGNKAYKNGDYTTARKDWEAAIALYPESTNALINLGNLYTQQLKDYAKAEMYFKKAASSVVPAYSASAYHILLDFYTNTGYKSDTTVYEDSLKEAIKRSPQAIEFRVLLARLYKQKGRIEESKAQFDAAIQVATAANNTALVTQLQSERDSF